MEHHPPLIQTKVTIPRAANLFSRPRLLDFLRNNLQRKLVLVCAGPGYGKTSLLVDFARSSGLPVCWYTLDGTDRDVLLFLDYLVEAIRVQLPGFGERTRALLHQGGVRDLRSMVGLLVNDLSEMARDTVVLILDEFQNVEEDETISQALDLLLEFLPPSCHLVIASRSIPPAISLVRMAARGEVAGVSADMLRFTEKEVQGVLEQQFGVQMERDRLRELTERSEGWITGILLGAQTVWQQYLEFLSRMPGPDRVYDYLVSEVLDRLEPEKRDFLVRASIPSRLEAGLCDELLGRQDSAEVLEWLERRNLFLVPLEGGWYRLHGLFRDSLLREARDEREEFLRLHRKAAQIWLQREEPVEAVGHLLGAEAYEEAARAVDGLAKAMFRRGHLQTLARWMEAIPEAVQLRFPRLVLCRGKVALETGNVEDALPLLQQAQHLLEQGGTNDTEDYVQAVADRSLCLRLRGSYDEALRVAREALPRAEEIGVPALVDLHRVIATSLLWQGRTAEAEKHYRAAVQHSLERGSPFSQASAYQDLGVCLRAQGRMEETEDAYREALARWEAVGNPGPMGSILNNLAMGPFLRGQFDEAGRLLQRALEAVDRSLSPYHRALVRASLGDLYRDTGELPAARRVYSEGLDVSRRSHHAALTNYLLEGLGNLARLEGAYGEARQYLHDALAAAGSSRSDIARIRVSLALLELAEGRIEEADKELSAAAAELEEAGDQLQLLRARLAQSVVWYRAGRWGEAFASLRHAEEIAAKMGVIEPFLAEAHLVRPLLYDLCPADEDGFLAKVRRQVTLWPATHKTGGEDDRAHLSVLALGRGRVFKNGTEIPLASWHGRKPREAFFYLFFNAPVTRDRFGADFWPDLGSREQSNRLHISVSRVRRAVGMLFDTCEKDIYRWKPGVSMWSDVEAFQKAAAIAAGMSSEDENLPFVLERALALYRGHFLEEFYSDWCVPLRDRLRTLCTWVLHTLGASYLSRRRFTSALQVYKRAVQDDPISEQAYRGLMRCYALTGERALAMQAYRQCHRHLMQELGTPPSPETQALHEAIGRGEELPPEPALGRP